MAPQKAARFGSGDALDIDPDAIAGDGIFGLDFDEVDSSVVLVPVPWDVTTSYRSGAANGWRAIRTASTQVDLVDPTLRDEGLAHPWHFGIHMREPDPRLATLNLEATGSRHDVDLVNTASATLNGIVYDSVGELLDADRLVGVVGGDHSVSFGAIRAHAERHAGLGLLQIDAHADLRHAYEGFAHSHASIIDNVLSNIDGVASVTQVGIRDLGSAEIARIADDDRITTWFEADVRRRMFDGTTWKQIVDEIVAPLPDEVYVTFDIDGLDPALCPNTGTPVPGGLGFAEASYLLESLHRHQKTVVGFDLTEVAPARERDDEWDGNVGARMLYRLSATALITNGARG